MSMDRIVLSFEGRQDAIRYTILPQTRGYCVECVKSDGVIETLDEGVVDDHMALALQVKLMIQIALSEQKK